jgi:hypothetical protein
VPVNGASVQLRDNRVVVIEGYNSELRLHNITLTPSLAKNLISPSQLMEQGHHLSLNIDSAHITVRHNGPIMLTAHHSHSMLISPLHVCHHAKHMTSATTSISLHALHCCLGHISKDHLLTMVRTAVNLCSLQVINNLDNCMSCIKGKLRHAPISHSPATHIN